MLFEILNGYLAPFNHLFDPPGNFRVSSLWFIVLVIIMSIVLNRTRYGNWVFAVGGNLEAALSQGINVRRIKFFNFTLSGLLAGVAGVILFAQRCSMNELFGKGLELTAVAASVLGGALLTGGKGSIVGAAIGILLLSLLEQGLVLMSVSNQIFRGLVGVIIIVFMIINNYLNQRL